MKGSGPVPSTIMIHGLESLSLRLSLWYLKSRQNPTHYYVIFYRKYNFNTQKKVKTVVLKHPSYRLFAYHQLLSMKYCVVQYVTFLSTIYFV